MDSEFLSMMLPLFGVVIGAILTFLTQYLLRRQQEKSDVRKKAIDVKNEQCLAFWNALSDTYRYLFFSGRYSPSKVDVKGLSEHIKNLNVAIIKTEPFISHRNYLRIMKVRDALNVFFVELEDTGIPGSEEYMAFIQKLEKPINVARDILREELQLIDLEVYHA